MEKITINYVDSAAAKRLKVGSGSGEKRLYIGDTNNAAKFDSFFEWDAENHTKVLIYRRDLLSYLIDARDEFFHPSQHYANNISEYYDDIVSQTEGLPLEVQTAVFEKNADPRRYYITCGKGPYDNMRNIMLPNLTSIEFLKYQQGGGFVIVMIPIFVTPDDTSETDTDEEALEIDFDNLPLQKIVYGAPGTGKSYGIDEDTKGKNVIRTTFHPDSDYSTFVGAYKPTMEECELAVVPVVTSNGAQFQPAQSYKEKRVAYKFVKQAFLKAYLNAWKLYANDTPTAVRRPGVPSGNGVHISVDSGEYDIIAVSAKELTQVRKSVQPKRDASYVWEKMWESGKYDLNSMSAAGFSIAVAIANVLYENYSDKTREDFENAWNKLIEALKSGERIESKPFSQNYILFYNPNDPDRLIVEATAKNTKEAVGNAYNETSKPTGFMIGLMSHLKSYDCDSFDKAWDCLAEEVDGTQANPLAGTGVVYPQFLIIEEINRGNCAQIFGDLFQLLDRGDRGFSCYPIDTDADIQREIARAFSEDPEYRLTKDINVDGEVKNYVSNYGATLSQDIQEGRVMLLPSNLHIWATMNTSDQSLFPIDSAFKRRWDWEYVPISKGYDESGAELKWAIEGDTKKFDWWSFLEKINALVGEATQSEDKKLGFFFCKAENGEISAEKFVGKVIFYLWNDVFRINGFNDSVFQDNDGTELTFGKFYLPRMKGKAEVNKEKVELFLTNLGVEELSAEDSDDDGSSTKFQLDNGGQDSLRNIVQKVVMNYANNNTALTAQEIRDTFVDAYQGCGIAHIVETEEEFDSRKNQPSSSRTVSEVVLSNGEKVYVSTQLRAKRETDNFFKFIKITKEKGWGDITPV